MKLLFLISIMSISIPTYAKWAFCAGQTQYQGVHCSNISFSFATFLAHQKCQIWAQNENLPLIKTFSFNYQKAALNKQREICDSIPNKGKWQCYVIEDCGTTSSISPIDVRIFAPSGQSEVARDECVKVGWNEYKQALINVNHGCKIAPDAVELMF